MEFGTYLAGTAWQQQISVTGDDLLRHCYLLGGTGSGKSNLLKHLMRQTAAFTLLDKEGDLAREIADSMPCIYWRAADFEHPVGLNPLVNVPRDERSRVMADIVELFSDIWGLGEETPRLIYYLRAVLRLLLDTNHSTLLDIRRVLVDDSYRANLLRKCTDRQTRLTWQEFAAKDPKQQATEISSLQNKAAALASSLPLQLILGQHSGTIDFLKAMDESTAVVCDLSGIGDDPARLLGAAIIFCVANSAYSRTGNQRKPYALIIDEFAEFATRTMPHLLSKARKRGLALILAHQYLTQIPEDVRDAILANCGTLVSFRVGVDDAHVMGRALDAPEQELANLGQGKPWIAPLQRGMRAKAVPIDVPLITLPTGFCEENKTRTRYFYARSRKDVELRFSKQDFAAFMAEKRRRVRAARDAAAKDDAQLRRDVQRTLKRKQLAKELEDTEWEG